MEEINGHQVLVYPNPTADYCTISEGSFNKATLSIYDLTGRVLISQPFNEKATIDIRLLKSGIYIFQIIDIYGKSFKGKVIKE